MKVTKVIKRTICHEQSPPFSVDFGSRCGGGRGDLSEWEPAAAWVVVWPAIRPALHPTFPGPAGFFLEVDLLYGEISFH